MLHKCVRYCHRANVAKHDVCCHSVETDGCGHMHIHALSCSTRDSAFTCQYIRTLLNFIGKKKLLKNDTIFCSTKLVNTVKNYFLIYITIYVYTYIHPYVCIYIELHIYVRIYVYTYILCKDIVYIFVLTASHWYR